MTEDAQRGEAVEQLLRAQPLRRAPENLELRVLARLSAQQQLQTPNSNRQVLADGDVGSSASDRGKPWWRESFPHWPLAARIVFLIASYGFIRFALAGFLSIGSLIRINEGGSFTGPVLSWFHAGSSVLAAVAGLGQLVVGAIPAEWLYGMAVLALGLYAALFGLGALAYRSLYVNQ